MKNIKTFESFLNENIEPYDKNLSELSDKVQIKMDQLEKEYNDVETEIAPTKEYSETMKIFIPFIRTFCRCK